MFNNINSNPDYQNLEVQEKNTIKARSYFIPYASFHEAMKDFYSFDVVSSSKYKLLSGKWEFKYFRSVQDIEESKLFRSGEYNFDTIDVPSCWQCDGYEAPFYVNNDFTCPAIPPLVPNFNPTGVYKKKFCLTSSEKMQRVVLSFLGVASGFTVFLNQQEVGYSQISHRMSEFDISRYVREGENELVVLVYKWTDGSYLESQDMFRYNGIFRDVYLTFTQKDNIRDFYFKYRMEGENAICSLDVDKIGRGSLYVRLCDRQGNVVYEDISYQNRSEFIIGNPQLWTAETPSCYKIFISLIINGKEAECCGHTVGFKTIDYSTEILKWNGKPIKIKGVNHHDTSPKTGFAVSLQQQKMDLEQIKSYNINTIRFSHYPTDPRVVDLCNVLGLYVIDEADLESYGSVSMNDRDYFGKENTYLPAFIKRMETLYERDKNHPCVLMWSLGNEAGIGQNFDASYAYLSAKQSGIPIQYETCYRDYPEYYTKEKKIGYDIISVMYPSMELIDEYMAGRGGKKPFYMCEYAHCMGLGPGSMKEYMDKIYHYDKFAGGCIWEWADHAVFHDKGKYKYTYGGEHGEYIHDGNFCVDGMVYPDRKPSSSALEIANAYRPVIVKKYQLKNEELWITFYNTNSFKDTRSYDFVFRIMKNGEVVKTFQENILIGALSEKEYVCSIEPDCERECVVDISILEKGAELGREQIVVGSYKYGFAMQELKSAPIITDRYITFDNGNKRLVFDKNLCTIVSYCIKNEELINQNPFNEGYSAYSGAVAGIIPNIWKAPNDNDIRYKEKLWYERLFNHMWTSFYHSEISNRDGIFSIISRGIFSPPKMMKYFDLETKYEIFDDFKVKITFKIAGNVEDLPFIPRFGTIIELKSGYNALKWYGLGERENYADFAEGSYLGTFCKKVEDMHEAYIKPQEHGTRGGIRYVEITDDCKGLGLKISSTDKPLYFNAKNYTIKDLERANHDEDIVKRDTTFLTIDGFFSGIGSNSCGPEALEQYKVYCRRGEELSFSFIMEAIEKNDQKSKKNTGNHIGSDYNV